MLRRHIVLLIAIRPSYGDVKPGGPLVLFEKSRLWAGTGFRVLPSFHHHLTQHNYTTQTATRTVTLTSTSYYTNTRPTCNVVCLSGAWFENRPHSMPSISHVRNPKCVTVQWVGIGTNKQKYSINAKNNDNNNEETNVINNEWQFFIIIAGNIWEQICYWKLY